MKCKWNCFTVHVYNERKHGNYAYERVFANLQMALLMCRQLVCNDIGRERFGCTVGSTLLPNSAIYLTHDSDNDDDGMRKEEVLLIRGTSWAMLSEEVVQYLGLAVRLLKI